MAIFIDNEDVEQQIKIRKETLDLVFQNEDALSQEESKEWRKFYSIAVQIYRKIDIDDYKYIRATGSFEILVYAQDNYLIGWGGSTIKIYYEEKNFIKKGFKRVQGVGKLTLLGEIRSNPYWGDVGDKENSGIYTVNIDYSKLDIFKELYIGMKKYYSELLEKIVYDKQAGMEFKKLVSFN